tara:strand:- start:878 stop:1672 length:795 start_codon:yes stop_codon:yes gene_type:complete
MKKNKKKFPLVSVIMNCFNGEKYLATSIKSVLNQSYKNLELIFWDNVSTDRSSEIIKSFSDKRIKYFKSKKFERLYKARNLALKKTKGKYICFLDVDDIYKKNFILEHLDKIKKDNCNIVYSKYLVKNEKTKKIYLNEKKKLSSGFITQNILSKNNVGISATLLKKSLFKKFKFNNKYQIIGDFDFFFNLSTKYRFCSLDRALLTYRFHDLSFTKKNTKIYLNELKSWLNSNKKKLDQKNINLTNFKMLIFKIRIKYFFNKLFN